MPDAAGPFGARYSVVRELGSGGTGTVYEVLDRAQGLRRVALKVLREPGADSVLRLKREFRSLADARHQNLVSLYELTADAQRCFFTLELIDGTDLMRWLRPEAPHRQSDVPTGTLDPTARSTLGRTVAVDFEKVTKAFRQLAEGITALHLMGQLHRDLKPSNVMVTREGRVVILDFGLVAPAGGGVISLSEAQGHTIAGTAAYMAPEQASSEVLGPAADWYAFGVMLFEALTGAVPFEGSGIQMMVDKQRLPARSIFDLSSEVPHGLAALCMSLLRRLPAERASAEPVIAALGGPDARQPVSVAMSGSTALTGREAELGQLSVALAHSRTSIQVVRVLGESGIGKTALVRSCLENARSEGAVVLPGRCSERESVPFKALDGVVDALATHLASLPIDRADALLPHDANALAKMFPVLRRAKGFREAPQRTGQDPVELRRRAVAGLRELLSRLADRHAVILFIDDSQWADRDSRDVLNDIVRGADAPAVLIVAASRGVPGEAGLVSGPIMTIELGPLPFAQCEVMVTKTTGAERARVFARESRGNPFLLLQLAHFGRDKALTLAELMELRLSELTAAERSLIETIAIAGAPLQPGVALEAAGLKPAQSDAILRLKTARLIRSSSDERLEMWHERLRDGVLSAIAPARVTEVHRGLGETLEALAAPADDEVELTAIHLAAAGLAERAATATLKAARTARYQLAFNRAATLYERALKQLNRTDPRRRAVAVTWGDTLSLAGRGAHAAAAYRLATTLPVPAADASARTGQRNQSAEVHESSAHFAAPPITTAGAAELAAPQRSLPTADGPVRTAQSNQNQEMGEPFPSSILPLASSSAAAERVAPPSPLPTADALSRTVQRNENREVHEPFANSEAPLVTTVAAERVAPLWPLPAVDASARTARSNQEREVHEPFTHSVTPLVTAAAAAERVAPRSPLPAADAPPRKAQNGQIKEASEPSAQSAKARATSVAAGSSVSFDAPQAALGSSSAVSSADVVPSQAYVSRVEGSSDLARSSADANWPDAQTPPVTPFEPDHASTSCDEIAWSNLELNRRSAEALLRAGHIDEGLLAVHEVLGELGMALAKTPRRALAALALRRLHVRLRGLSFTPRPAASVRPQTLTKIDACWSVSVGLAMVDTIRGASFQTRQLLLALDAGEPFRVSRALAAEAAFVATGGVADEARARALIERARALALNAPATPGNDLIGLIDFCHGLTRFLVGDWAQARTFSAIAERRFSELGAPVSWEAASARLFSVWSLFYLGDIEELSARIPALLEEAEARGDLYAITSLRSGLANVALLAAGDPVAARAAVHEVMGRWSATSFHFQHYWALLSEGLVDLYEGKAADGWARNEAAWPLLKKSQLLRIQNVRIEACFLRARLALATGRQSTAATIARALERERAPWATGFAELIHAALWPAKASLHLANALTIFESQHMRLFAAAARLRLASTQPDALRHENERAALAWLRGQRIADPVRLATILVPHVVPHGSNLTLSLG